MKIKKTLFWIATNIGLGLVAWFAVNGNVGAGNVLMGFSWVLAIISIMCYELKNEIIWDKEVERSVPKWSSTLFEITLMSFLFWYGWWFTSIAVLISWAATETLYDFHEQKKKRK